jgi:hypothetical protein
MATLSKDIIELTSDEDELALLPAAKSISKGKSKSKGITTTSSDSPLTSAPESDPEHPKPKSKTRKRSKVAHPTSPYQSTFQGTTTSSLHDSVLPIPFHLLSSQLPPSDPPTSTASTCDVPPIETLPNLDTDPLSSPSSLFSAPTLARRKRKRPVLGIDELDSDDHQGPGINMDVDTELMPPPPMPRLPLAKPTSPIVDPTLHAPPNYLAERVDLSILPSTADASVDPSPAKKTKTAKPRKKKGEEDLAENGESGKVKPKAKAKEKKQKKNVEVLIRIPKGKGKEKEVFKSLEFIEDDEEDEGLVVETSSGKKATFNKPSSMTSLSSVPGSDGDDTLIGPSKMRKSSGDSVERSAKDDVRTDEEDEPTPKKSTTKAKRQTRVLSEDEDEGLPPFSPPEDVSLNQPSNANGMSKGKGKSKKARNSLQRGSDKQTKDTDGRNVDATEPQQTLKVSLCIDGSENFT